MFLLIPKPPFQLSNYLQLSRAQYTKLHPVSDAAGEAHPMCYYHSYTHARPERSQLGSSTAALVAKDYAYPICIPPSSEQRQSKNSNETYLISATHYHICCTNISFYVNLERLYQKYFQKVSFVMSALASSVIYLIHHLAVT